MKLNRLVLLAVLVRTRIVLGAVIKDVVVCHDFDSSGAPVPQEQFPVSTDAVFVWVNMNRCASG